jgi:LuxR family maltose regulon positive regulatory protein
LARTYYEWNDVVTAQQHAEQSLELARQVEIASFVTSELILARLQLARGDVSGAIASLAGTAQAAQAKRFSFRLPEVVAVQVFALLRQGHIEQAEQLAGTHDLPLSRARVQLARGDNSAALETLESYRQQVEARAWHDERFKVMQLQALALHALGDTKTALQVLGETLAMAEPEGFIRAYVDEGPAMAELLSQAAVHGIAPEYVNRLLAAFTAEGSEPVVTHALLARPSIQTLAEPLSQRELEILRLIANGLSNREIGERLFLALATVKGHNRNIFGKLQVQRRTEAVARARELGLL